MKNLAETFKFNDVFFVKMYTNDARMNRELTGNRKSNDQILNEAKDYVFRTLLPSLTFGL